MDAVSHVRHVRPWLHGTQHEWIAAPRTGDGIAGRGPRETCVDGGRLGARRSFRTHTSSCTGPHAAA